jgi:hypothetical protein
MEFRAQVNGSRRVFHETHVQKGYTLGELTGGLSAAGFEVLSVYDAYTTRPPGPKTDRYFLVARRPVSGKSVPSG